MTFVLVVLVLGWLEFGVVWGLVGAFDLPPAVLRGGLLLSAAVALAGGARTAWSSWQVERDLRADPAGGTARSAPPA